MLVMLPLGVGFGVIRNLYIFKFELSSVCALLFKFEKYDKAFFTEGVKVP